MRAERKYVLSIAGFDPSGGAGVLADVKTFEAHKVYGLGVITANTFQNDNEFLRTDWLPVEKIAEQIDVLSKRFSFDHVKIGLVESLDALLRIVEHCISKNANCRIIWDPILKASAGFEFHKTPDRAKLETILKKLFLVTPNIPEALSLGKESAAEKNALHLANFCSVYLKGGHREDKLGYDTLYLKEGKQFSFRPHVKNAWAKHGSGCVLSSAIAANLAKGENLQRACLMGKEYVERFLDSNKSLVGYHKL